MDPAILHLPVGASAAIYARENCSSNRLSQRSYRFEYWCPLRARLCPYFFRSFIRESRVKNPSFRNVKRSAGSLPASARAMPWRTAPAWPEIPPPKVVTTMSARPSAFAARSGCRMIVCRVSVGKYSSNGRPLIEIFPVPGTKRTRATASLRRPVPMGPVSTATTLTSPIAPREPASAPDADAGARGRRGACATSHALASSWGASPGSLA